MSVDSEGVGCSGPTEGRPDSPSAHECSEVGSAHSGLIADYSRSGLYAAGRRVLARPHRQTTNRQVDPNVDRDGLFSGRPVPPRSNERTIRDVALLATVCRAANPPDDLVQG